MERPIRHMTLDQLPYKKQVMKWLRKRYGEDQAVSI